jgi:hypothetical protein
MAMSDQIEEENKTSEEVRKKRSITFFSNDNPPKPGWRRQEVCFVAVAAAVGVVVAWKQRQISHRPGLED